MFFTRGEAGRLIRHLHGPEATPEAFAGELWEEDFDGTFRIAVPKNKACTFLVEGRCTVNEFKPLQCKTYPFWPEILHSPRSWKAEHKYCEGLSPDGDHYELLRIARILNGDGTS